MANKKAWQLIRLGLHPVLLGSAGHDLKRPLRKGWQTAVYTPEDVASGQPATIWVFAAVGSEGDVLSSFSTLMKRLKTFSPPGAGR